jgi:hypothetical protein
MKAPLVNQAGLYNRCALCMLTTFGTNGGLVMKLDLKFYGTIYKAKDDSIVPDDEYVVFLAKDNAFAAFLPIYLQHCIKHADERQIAAVRDMIERVNAWRTEHPERCKNPDIEEGEKLLSHQ